MSTSLKSDLLAENLRSSNAGLQNFLPVNSKDSASGKKSEKKPPPTQS